MSGVPETARDEYYELELKGNKAVIRAASFAGVLWGVRTLTGIYRAASMGTRMSNLAIRDWPDMPNRGIFVEDKWGPDRMTLSDWCLVIDRMSLSNV